MCCDLFILQIVHQNYMEKGAKKGPEQYIEFEDDMITVEIPDSVEYGGWTITMLTPPVVCSIVKAFVLNSA